MNTIHPGYTALERGLSGLRRHQESLNRTADRIAGTAPLGDTPGDMVQLMNDARGFQANARTVRTADELVGTLLDILA